MSNSMHLPCDSHEDSVSGYMGHLEGLIEKWYHDLKDVCVVIPCDSIEAWIVAAYDGPENVEKIENPWMSVIAKKKYYHDIRITGTKKRIRLFSQFARGVSANWNKVTKLCLSAKKFEDDIILLSGKNNQDISKESEKRQTRQRP